MPVTPPTLLWRISPTLLVLIARSGAPLHLVGSPRVPLLNFWIPVSLALTSRIILFLFVSMLSVSVPHYITQRVPIPCQQRACAVKLLSDYLLSLFSHYLFSFIPRTITYFMASNVSSPKGFHILTYFISVSLIVFPDRALLFEGFTPYYTQSVGIKNSSVFKQSRRARIISLCSHSISTCVLSPLLHVDSTSHYRYRRRACLARHHTNPFIALSFLSNTGYNLVAPISPTNWDFHFHAVHRRHPQHVQRMLNLISAVAKRSLSFFFREVQCHLS